MKNKVRERAIAILMRKQGASYREILEKVHVSKSTVSNWLKDLPLTASEKRYLRTRTDSNISRGRIKAATANRNLRIQREVLIRTKQKTVFLNRKNDHIFLLGIALYWAEGSNKSSQFLFVNSDPAMIVFMHSWIRTYLKVSKEKIGVRIFMHKTYSADETERYWCDLLQIDRKELKTTVFKPTSHKVKHNVHYKGCVRLEVSGIDKYHTIMVWKDCLKKCILERFRDSKHP